MSVEDFQLIDNTEIDNSIIKRDFTKIYHQQRAQLNNPSQNIDFIFGENNNYHQIGNSYLEFTITLRKNNGDFEDDNSVLIRLVNNAFAFCFREASIKSTGGHEIELNKFVGQTSTMMRLLTSKDGDLSTCFDKVNENNINNTSLKEILIDNHTVRANNCKIVGQLPLEHIFGFCKTFKKITKGLGYHITLKTSDLNDIIYTTLPVATPIQITFDSLYLFVPSFIPNAETQVMFNDSVKNSSTLSFDSWITDRKIVNNGNEFQIDIGSAQNINSPKYLIIAHQTANRIATSDREINNAISDNLNVRKYFCEKDGGRYPKDEILLDYESNNYLDQYRDLKVFYKEYVDDLLLSPFINYPDMKNFYPIQVIDLRFQTDHISPKKNTIIRRISK